MNTKFWGVAATLVFLAGIAPASANLIINGSFEDTTNFVADPAHPGDDTMRVFLGDSTTMPSWTVVNGSLAWIGPSNPFGLSASPGAGNYFLDLTDYRDALPFGGVSQTIATTIGGKYLLSFDLGSAPAFGIQDAITASAGSTFGTFTSTNPTLNNFWEREILAFTATSNSTLITLVGNTGQSYIGLDNVDVTSAVPEASTWAMMLLGFAGIGYMAYRRQRKALSAA